MDRKSLIYVLALTTALLLTNQWLSYNHESKLIEKVKNKPDSQEPPVDLSQTRIPIHKVFGKDDQQEKKTFSFQIDQNYFVFQTSNAPKELLIENGNKKLPVFRQDPDKSQNYDIYLYSTEKSTTVQTAYMPSSGSTKVYVLEQNKDGSPNLQRASYENDKIYFNTGYPTSDALVLYNLKGKYFPVGIYLKKSKEFLHLSELSSLSPLTVFMPGTDDRSEINNETLYVLENDFQQVVFSTNGGCIVELNLPFASKSNPKSIVRKTQIDKTLSEKNTNVSYPLKPYYIVKNDKRVKEKPKNGGYFPLIRRSQTSGDGRISMSLPPEYGATALVNESQELNRLRYKVTSFTKNSITLSSSFNGKPIRKTYTLAGNEAPYLTMLDMEYEGPRNQAWITTGIPEVELISGNYTPQIQYYLSRPGNSATDTIKLPKSRNVIKAVDANWVSNSNGFFGIILDPKEKIDAVRADKIGGDIAPSRHTLLDQSLVSKYPGYDLFIPIGSSTKQSYSIYAGPLDSSMLSKSDQYLKTTQNNMDQNFTAAQSHNGWFTFISIPFAKFLFFLMNIFHTLTGSWGFSIILLTIALRVMLYPLNAWSLKSMAKMQTIQPKVTQIQERYKKDPQKAQLEIMQLYKKEKVNPLSGCLPLLIQMPFLFGMFDLLKSSFSLRGASFIPGWIDNLAAPDVLFTWGPKLPFLGNEFHLLPVFMGAAMFLQQKISAPKKTQKVTEQQRQQVAMGNIMSIVMIAIFYNMPSGLNIYFLSSTLLAVAQQWYIKSKMKQEKVT